MSGRPQGRGRQTRRDRSQRNRGRDNSADSVGSTTSTQSERDREQRNGRNSRRRPEKKDERGKRRNEENRRDVPERESSKANVVEKDKGKQRSENEKQPSRGRGETSRDATRELNRENFVAKGSANGKSRNFALSLNSILIILLFPKIIGALEVQLKVDKR